MLQGLVPEMSGMVAGMVQLCLCGFVGLLVTFVLCYAFRIPEVSALIKRLKRS